jgi:SARP family transcriptional regulator, regulator of embCAB operon
LACLVVHAGEPVSTDRLVEELWGEDGSAGAARAMQTYVSQLRKLLKGETASLQTQPRGYALRADHGELFHWPAGPSAALNSAGRDPGR